jgi:hypothetical protein
LSPLIWPLKSKHTKFYEEIIFAVETILQQN